LNDTVHLLPPITQRGRRKKFCFNLNFCRPLSRLEPTDRTQWPTTHRAPARKPRRGGRALAVAPHGRPAGCSPCSTVQGHSLGPINNSQHSSNRGGEQTGKENRGERARRKRKNRGERGEEIERRREKEERRTKRNREEEREERRDQPENKRKKANRENEEKGRNGENEPNRRKQPQRRRESLSVNSSTSTASSSISNDSATTSSAPGNPSSSPILVFLYFLLCMQNE